MIANVTSILNKAPTALLFSRKAKLSVKTKAALTQAFSKEEKGDRSGFPERAKLFWGFAPAVDEDALMLMNI